MISLHIDTAVTWRGGQNQALLTVLGLRGLGHRTVLVAHPRGELRRRTSEGPDVIPFAPRAEMDLHSAWRLSRIVRDLAPDVVHAHDPHGVAAAALALSLTPGSSCPPLVASRRVDFHIKANAFSRWKYRQVRCFLCASDVVRHMLIADGVPAAQTVTVHEGIDLEHVDAHPVMNVHAEFWLPSHAPLIGSVAALVPHKGQRYLIDALALLVREVPDARLVIAGEGELQGALERQIKERNLEKHVVLAGFRPDALSLMKGFDVFVLSSVTEGLGTSLLDAMACRRAIVATEAGGIPEVIVHGGDQETGVLVPPKDPAALAGALVQLLTDPERRTRMGQAGRRRVQERFSAEKMVQETLKVYEAVVQSPVALSAAGDDRFL